jgi:hypothetical protein
MISVDPSSFNCAELKRFLYDYIERELDEAILIALDNHVICCPDCEHLVNSYRDASETPREHLKQPVSMPGDVKFQIVESLSQSEK